MKKINKYEFNGVMEYANVFTFEIEAKTEEEAKRKALVEVENHIRPEDAEFIRYILDDPISLPKSKS